MTLAAQLLGWYVSKGPKGGTVDECCRVLKVTNYSASSAISRLTRAGHLVRTDESRLTRMKRPASVYVHQKWAPVQSAIPTAKSPLGLSKAEQAALMAFRKYVRARKSAAGDPKTIQKALYRLMKDVAVAAEG